jgi:hypothetical protein
MTAAEQLANTLDMLAKAKAAYARALSGAGRIATHLIDTLLASVKYWQGEVDKWDAITTVPPVVGPLRVYL